MDAQPDESEIRLKELQAEVDCLDPSFVHATRLLTEEINRVQNGEKEKEEKAEKVEVEDNTNKPKSDIKMINLSAGSHVKLCVKVLIPVKEHPKFNFIGKLLGPRGNSLKRLQDITGTKIAILGRGSMRDKQKEESLRGENSQKYAHLNEDLHVQIELSGAAPEAYHRLAYSIGEVQKYLVPDPNDTIRQDQLRELAVISGSYTGPPPNAPSPRSGPRGGGPGGMGRGGWGGGPPPMRPMGPHSVRPMGHMSSPARMGSPPGRGMARGSGISPRGAPSRGLSRLGPRGGASASTRMGAPSYGSQMEGGDDYYERGYDQSYNQGYEESNTTGGSGIQDFGSGDARFAQAGYEGPIESETSWGVEAAPSRLKYPSAMHQKETLRTHPYNRY